MNRFAIRTGLGIAIYLSYSALYSHSSFALSLNFSDRYELTPANLNPEIDNQTESQEPSNFIFLNNQQAPELSSLPELTELFSAPTYNIQIQTASSESEDTNLLGVIADAFGDLQFSNIDNNSAINPNVAILPQVSFQDVYRGLYDFEIETGATSGIVPRVANNSIPDESLISQESISGYNPQFFASQSFSNNNSKNYLSPSDYRYSLSSLVNGSSNQNNRNQFQSNQSLYGGNVNSLLNRNSYEDVLTRAEGILVNNTNVYIEPTEIEVKPQYKVTSASQKFQAQKDPKQQALEEELANQKRIRDQKRSNLLRKLRNEQQQREMKRQQQAIKTKRQREDRLRRQQQQITNLQQRQNNAFQN